MRTLTLIILLIIWPSAAYSWQWRITERGNTNVTCVNGQCVPKYQTPVANDTLSAKSITNAISVQNTLQDCPDGRCPLVKREVSPSNGSAVVRSIGSQSSGVNKLQALPTLAPPEPRVIVQAKPVRSVMVQPVRRAFQWRPFKRLFGRR